MLNQQGRAGWRVQKTGRMGWWVRRGMKSKEARRDRHSPEGRDTDEICDCEGARAMAMASFSVAAGPLIRTRRHSMSATVAMFLGSNQIHRDNAVSGSAWPGVRCVRGWPRHKIRTRMASPSHAQVGQWLCHGCLQLVPP